MIIPSKTKSPFVYTSGDFVYHSSLIAYSSKSTFIKISAPSTLPIVLVSKTKDEPRMNQGTT